MNIQESADFLRKNLSLIYPKNEAEKLTDITLEHTTGLSFTQRIIHKNKKINQHEEQKIAAILKRLLNHEPIQYILNEAWFCNQKFYVNEHVLIPRPETEELVMWITESVASNEKINILDIGTGSGCIAISLKKLLPKSSVTAIDISLEAIKVAKKNALENDVKINFLEENILKEDFFSTEKFDVIVSNPPYIAKSEMKEMNENVLAYEPHRALFVEDYDPFIFYKKIIHFSNSHLQKNGMLFFEINEMYGKKILELMMQENFEDLVLKKDLQEKDRMIKGRLKNKS